MQSDLRSLEKWCNMNSIHVNISKTKFMIFGSKVMLAKSKDMNIQLTIDKQKLTRVHSYNYTLDEQLNYELHAQNISKKVKNKLIQLISI